MAVELQTVEGVPLIRVGTYELASGATHFSEEALKAAADAWATDAAVKDPRVKIASVEKALNLDPAAHGGEPAFGYFDNLRVTDDGQTLVADLHAPEGVVAAMEWAYPSLSIEGTAPGWTSATGRSHELVITAVALLGVHWPGVTTLDDFTEFLASGPKIEKTDAPEQVLATMRASVHASLDSDLVVRRFIESIDAADAKLPEGVQGYDLWPRSMRFDDTGKPYLKVTDEASGTLYRVDFKVSGSDVTFDGFQEVVEQDVPVAAGAARPAAPLASWSSREAVRATATSQEAPSMTDEQRRALAAAFGLAEDATEAQIMEKADAAKANPLTQRPAEHEPEPVGDGEGQTAPDPAKVPEPVAARAKLPEGVSAIDSDELSRLRAAADTAEKLARNIAEKDRDDTINAAIGQGRFAPSRREHYVKAWAADPEGTRTLLTAPEAQGGLAPNTVPVEARGHNPQGDTINAGEGTGWFDDRFSTGQEG